MTVANRRERERQERRSSILDAAEEVFRDKGFDHATMGDIARAAELSKGTLYLYFKSKDDLYIALSSRRAAEIVKRCEAAVGAAVSGVDAIRSMLDIYAAAFMANPQHFRIMIGRMASGDHLDTETPSYATHQRLIERIIQAFITAVENGRRDGSLRRDLDPVQTSSQLWGGLLGTILLRINGEEMNRRYPRPIDYTKFVEGYIQLVCNGLQPGSAETSP